MRAAKRAGASSALPSHLRFWLAVLALGLVMALALPTEPLFYGNQNTKFLHGLAEAGYGHLDEDWQANTRDPLPVFSGFVRLVAQYAGTHAFYLCQLIVFLSMAAALITWHQIVVRTLASGWGDVFWPFLLALVLLHTSQAGAKLFQGVATQYLVDRAFEPANFGILALAGVAAIAVRRYLLGVAGVLIAALFHPAYAVPGGMLLVAALLLVPCADRRRGWATIVVGGAVLGGYILWLALALPSAPGSGGPDAAGLITDVRIPDHSHVARWFDVDAAFKAFVCVLAAFAARRHRIGRFLAVALALTVVTTLATLLPETSKIRLVAPWRTSVVLVPMANVVVLTLTLAQLQRHLHGRPAWHRELLVGSTIVSAIAIGGVNLAQKFPRYLDDRDKAYVHWLREHGDVDTVVLTPVVAQDFRLASGLPQYVSFKTHPYVGTEVHEWYRRITVARRIQRRPSESCGLVRAEARRSGVTHVVWPAKAVDSAPCAFLERVYRDRRVAIFRLDLGG